LGRTIRCKKAKIIRKKMLNLNGFAVYEKISEAAAVLLPEMAAKP
jgi:hypothetical protein